MTFAILARTLKNVRPKWQSVSFALLFLIFAARPAKAQLSVPLTIQEAVYPGAPTQGITRTQDPVTVGIPLPDSAGITSTSQLGLSGASVGQFRVLGRWPSGNIKWVLVDTQADVTAGQQNTGISLTTGSGNFGGANLASDNGGSITVNTGSAQFTIRKKNFNVFDQVVVNGKTVVASGTSPGLVLTGPSGGATTCGNCTDAYLSSNDSSSTAVIEENGPARTVIKAVGSHVDAGGNVYMHFTVRMHFYRGKSSAKVEVILRNADETNNPSGDFNSATKGFASYEVRVAPALGGSRSFNIGTDGNTSATGSFSSNENAYLYQAYSNDMETSDWNADNCPQNGWDRCVASPIARTGNKGVWTYAQDGYQIVHGSSVLASGDHTRYPQGWADVSDGSGTGVEIGVYQLSAYWPKSLQLMSGGADVRVGIWPNQSLFTKGGGQAYYQGWPAYSVHDLYFNFHSSALPSAENSFLAFQHYLLGRAPVTQYNKASADFYSLLDPTAEDNFLKANSIVCCMKDINPRIWRHYDWPGAGAGNQHELRWSYVRNFLERGLPGRYLFGAHFYRLMVEHGFPRADGFSWRNHPVSQLDYRGFPTITSANWSNATREFMDGQHAHWYGMVNFYFLTGDETIHDQLLDGAKTDFLNGQTKVNNGAMWASRDVGERLMGLARLYQFYSATGDPDANLIQPMAEQVMSKQVFPELNVSGYGVGNPVPGGSQGISRTRGIHYGCCAADNMPPLSGRTEDSFHQAILEEGLYEISRALGPGWKYYTLTNDLMYGNAEWNLTEGYGTARGQQPNPFNTGFVYESFLDLPNDPNNPYYMAPGNVQTNWFTFFVPAVYSGDMSWQQAFTWFLQRGSGDFHQNWAEYGSHMMQAVIDKVINPPALQLTNVPLNVHNNGGGSYTLSWTVPANAVSYRIKYEAGKKIVDWLGFNAGTNKFIGDPSTTWPWFSATEVPNPPGPNQPNTPQNFTVTGLDPTQTYNFALKAYVGGTQGDHTPPTVAITSPQNNGSVSGLVALSANASDNVAVAWVKFSIDGVQVGSPIMAPPYSMTWDSTTVSNGVHQITATASDTSGNLANASVQVTVNNSGDHTPPTVTITSPAPNSVVQNTVTVSANATDNVAVAWVLFQVDGQAIGPKITAPPYSLSWDTTKVTNGPHTITAIAADTSNNQSTVSEQVTVNNSGDHTPPTVTITAPAPNAVVSGTINLSANASDNVGVAWVFFEVDNIAVSPKITTPPYTFSWNSSSVPDGGHTITAVASDLAGNNGTASENITVSNGQKPTITIVAPQPNAVVSGTISVIAGITNIPQINSIVFTANSKLIGTLSGPNLVPPYSIQWDTTKFANGPVTLAVAVATATSNNSLNASEGVTVNNSNQGPQVSITSPTPGTISGTVTFAASATSKVGIKNVSFQVDSTSLGTVNTPPYQLLFDTTTVTNGVHVLTATATDLLGNNAKASEQVTVSNSQQQSVTLTPSSINFGHQKVGTQSGPRVATLTNGTSVTLHLSSISATGDFSQTNNCGVSVGPGGSCSITVTFTPNTSGTRVGTLTVVDDAPNSPQTVSLSGYGDIIQGNCPANGWCQIYNKPLLPNNGYNRIFFVPDTDKFYLYANSNLRPPTTANGPEGSTFWSYTVQSSPVTSNPWDQVSGCGDNALTEGRQQYLQLKSPLGPSDTTVTLLIGQKGNMSLKKPDFPQSGSLWIGDEVVKFTGCTSTGNNSNCQAGATSLTLTGVTRGVRQTAGWLAPYGHAVAEEANLACADPTLNNSPSGDHPPDRHSVANPTYDSKRGRIWVTWGFQENFSFQDAWYLCIFNTASCNNQQIAAGWQRVPMYTTNNLPPAGYQENATIYDPDTDSLFSYGGFHSGPTGDQFIYCLSAPAKAYGCNGQVGKWLQVTPHGGFPGERDAIRMAWDTVNHRILVYGGMGPADGQYTNTVAVYNNVTGDWCISDPSKMPGSKNAASCTLPTLSGTPPPVDVTDRFPAWTYDTTRGKGMFLNFANVYAYDAAQNKWIKTTVPPGPPAPGPNKQPQQSWAYDSVDDMYVWVEGGEDGQLWQLPGSALQF